MWCGFVMSLAKNKKLKEEAVSFNLVNKRNKVNIKYKTHTPWQNASPHLGRLRCLVVC
jgi:hypothetical protein